MLFALSPLSTLPLVSILVTFCVIAIVTTLAWWVLTKLGAPAPFPTIVIVVGVVVGVIYILDAFGLLNGLR